MHLPILFLFIYLLIYFLYPISICGTSTCTLGVKGNFSSLMVLNKKVKVCLRWDVGPSTGHVVLCKRLRDEGLHAFKGKIG